MDKHRVKLYAQKSEYDTRLSKTVNKLSLITDTTCFVTGISNKRQLENFGNLTSADTTIRLLNKDVIGVTHASIKDEKYKITKVTSYDNDVIIYALKVQSW
ncbi:hypothetical protein CA207_06980 [Macrococcoides caseolyticum]|nr:hypothetical protein CA207_06980 [Macrococcus caseolyticus]